jgi:hypothetical protein
METSNPLEKSFREAYINLNITYADLSRMLAERLGVTQRTVYNYRCQRSKPDTSQEQIINEFFDHLREMYMPQQPA